jgi:hypothetical protein
MAKNPYPLHSPNWAVQEKFNIKQERNDRLMQQLGMNWQTMSSMIIMESKNREMTADELVSEKLGDDHQAYLSKMDAITKSVKYA